MKWTWFCIAGILLFIPLLSDGRLMELEILEERPFANGESFGEKGPYEILIARASFAADPTAPANQAIIDLDKAPKDERKLVHYYADVCILKPVAMEKGNGVILYDVNNRGNKLALRFFNDAPGNANELDHAGNGFLMRHGYTVVWCGWIAEIRPGDSLMRLHAPVATDENQDITGLIRTEIVTNTPTTVMPVKWNDVHGSYEPTETGLKEAVLTWRLRESDMRIPIPRDQWNLEVIASEKVEETQILPLLNLHIPAGFRPGYIYELIYEGKGPIVQGLGFAVMRDLISWLRASVDQHNPLLVQEGQIGIQLAYAFGISQSGRFLRDFLYQGFNADEDGQRVFDAIMPTVAGGGRGSFNHRFAEPTWTNMQHLGHSYPADRFPFTYTDATDPFSGKVDGLLRQSVKTNTAPKIFQVDSSAEYWSRSGSLSHTDPSGTADALVPENVRFYLMAGSQHGYGAFPPKQGIEQHPTNPLDYRPILRALLVALDQWTREGKNPPPSLYPRIDSATLVDWKQKSVGFPYLPGTRFPEVIQQPGWFDYGPEFEFSGIVSIQPPVSKGVYKVLVPKTDEDGNDSAGIRLPEIAVPIGTYTGWNLRCASAGAENELVDLAGSFIPFAKTKVEREKTGDPRLSLEERYKTFDEYVNRFQSAANQLVADRYLLIDDANKLIADCERFKEFFNGN
ncbi:MAG: hypothetical protein C4527_06055 [Candidatus Omnitrophota bacterium]|nr:MAG: hypothetical protein C4527_06055 [Candidatus Omnitrophota bacterium]